MSSRRLMMCGVLVLLALRPAGAAADPEEGGLVIEGAGGTTTEWVLEADSPLHVDSQRPEVTGGGDYAGILIEPLDRAHGSPLGALQVRVFGDRTSEAVGMLGIDGVLEPGRYRVTLLGQGPVRVRYTEYEERGVRITPRTPIRVDFAFRAEPLAAGADSARVELPQAAPAGRRVVQALLLDRSSLGDHRMCATAESTCEQPLLLLCPPAPAPCGEPSSPGPWPGGHVGDPTLQALLHPPHPASRSLLWTVDGVRDGDDRLRAAVLVF